ncbi:MAG: hypothetical protein J0I06_11555 [Planctomycetes bacterium]|nr:hypothetical protein [Planctomycetota bacterium]
MTNDESRMLVNVFETIGHAERAVGSLLADGYHPGQIAVVETAQEAHGLGPVLTRLGVTAELAGYYENEVRDGRVLVAVRHAPGDADDVRTTLARNGGAVRVPLWLRDRRT